MMSCDVWKSPHVSYPVVCINTSRTESRVRMITGWQCSWTGVQPQKKDDHKENQTLPSNCANLSAQLTSPLPFCSTWQRTSKLIPLVRSTPKTSIPTCHTSLSAFPPTVSLVARSSCCFGLLFCFFFSSEGCLSEGLFKGLTQLLTAVSWPLWRRSVQHTHTLEVIFWFSTGRCLSSLLFHVIVSRAAYHPADSSSLSLIPAVRKMKAARTTFKSTQPVAVMPESSAHSSRVVEPQGVTASSWNTGKFTPPPTLKSERCE